MPANYLTSFGGYQSKSWNASCRPFEAEFCVKNTSISAGVCFAA